MKSIKYTGICGILCLLAACTDLTPEVFTDVRKEDYFQTTAQFSTLIANAYSQLAGEYGYIYREGYWSMQEYTTDEVVVPTRGTDWYDAGVPIAMHTQTWETNTRDINNGWSFAYGGVTKCNTVIDNIHNLQGDDESTYSAAAKAGIAEARVLRAFYHLLAMDLYGNVHVDDGSGEPVKQLTRKEVFEWIEGQILDNLDDIDDVVTYGNMTKPVAYMILAKMYLNAEVYTGTPRWEDCEKYCQLIIGGGYGYDLNEDYFTTFKKDNTGNKEIIFPIVFDQVYAQGNMFHLITGHYVMQEAYGYLTQPWNGPCTLPSFYNSYSDDDKRKAQWFVGPIQKDGKTLQYQHSSWDAPKDAIIVPEVTALQDPTANNTFEGARFFKFEIEPGIEYHANSDFPIYRYADVLLMSAEAYMRQNGGSLDTDHLEYINKVHRRAGLKDYTAAEVTYDELLAERGRELAWEGHRRDDLIRFGKFTTGMWEFMDPRTKDREIFPIPDWVRDGAPGVYQQNPGY